MRVCVYVFVMTFNIVAVSNSIYGCTFCIYSNIYICLGIDLLGINLNCSSIFYVLLVRLIGGIDELICFKYQSIYALYVSMCVSVIKIYRELYTVVF